MAPIIRGNSLYTVVDSNTWTGAKNEAKQLGGDLVTINNREEDIFVQSIFGPSAPLSGGLNFGYWMGLYRDPSSSGYSWSDWKWINSKSEQGLLWKRHALRCIQAPLKTSTK